MGARILLGLFFLIAGLWLLLPLPTGLPYQGAGWDEFIIFVKGAGPAFGIFLGVLILWIGIIDRKGV